MNHFCEFLKPVWPVSAVSGRNRWFQLSRVDTAAVIPHRTVQHECEICPLLPMRRRIRLRRSASMYRSCIGRSDAISESSCALPKTSLKTRRPCECTDWFPLSAAERPGWPSSDKAPNPDRSTDRCLAAARCGPDVRPKCDAA